jgi:small subunit ribosomal protein S8
MSVHDTIGDFITVIRNAGKAGKETCSYPRSNLSIGIVKILKSRGFVANCNENSSDNGHKNVVMTLV